MNFVLVWVCCMLPHLATSSCRRHVNESATGLSLSPRHKMEQAADKAEAVVVNHYILYQSAYGWLRSRVVSVLHSGAEGPGFKSQSRCCRVTVLGKLFTPIVPLFTKQQYW